MKKFTLVLGSLMTLFFISCEGPRGLDGFDGRDGADGQDGAAFEAAAFEITKNLVLDGNIYTTGANEYPTNLTLLSDDVIFIYRLEEVVDGLDVWRQLPQPFFSDEGLLYYNFDFTQSDYSVIIEPEFDVLLVPTNLIRNQTFRVVIIPSIIVSSSKMDTSNINSVLGALDITESEIQKFTID